MNTLKVLIVDDEPLARERLAHLMPDAGDFELVAEAANGIEALAAVGTHRPDVVLLDIRMPGMDGLECARHLAGLERPPAIVFTTAYGDHALEAFDANALDYLLKPVRPERLLTALAKAQAVHAGQLDRARGPSVQARSHLSAVIKGNLHVAAVAELRYLQADQKYVTAGWPGGQLLLEEPLKSLEEEFGGRFLRVHRNALAARAYIRSLEKDGDGNWFITLHGVAERLAVSRRLLPCVRKALKGDLPLRDDYSAPSPPIETG
jgi:two-component system response regulator AlgR